MPGSKVKPQGYFHTADVVIASALTPLHIGTGRMPGVVDLPVMRDPFGIPYVPGSAIKGALKTALALRSCSNDIDENGFIKCDECRNICCLFGPEPGQGDKGAASLSFTELLPIAFPVPCLEHGYVYATSPYLAARGLAVLKALTAGGDGGEQGKLSNKLANLLKKIVNEGASLTSGEVLAPPGEGGSVSIGLDIYAVKGNIALNDDVEFLKTLNPMYDGKPLASNLYVFSDDDVSNVIEKGMYRVARIALMRSTKTVRQRMLWTEEYLPPSTLLLGLIAYSDGRNEYCKDDRGGSGCKNVYDVRKEFLECLKSIGGAKGFVLIIGGKETVGKGIIRASLITCDNGNR